MVMHWPCVVSQRYLRQKSKITPAAIIRNRNGNERAPRTTAHLQTTPPPHTHTHPAPKHHNDGRIAGGGGKHRALGAVAGGLDHVFRVEQDAGERQQHPDGHRGHKDQQALHRPGHRRLAHHKVLDRAYGKQRAFTERGKRKRGGGGKAKAG